MHQIQQQQQQPNQQPLTADDEARHAIFGHTQPSPQAYRAI